MHNSKESVEFVFEEIEVAFAFAVDFSESSTSALFTLGFSVLLLLLLWTFFAKCGGVGTANCDVDDDKIREIFKDVEALESAISSTKISLESIMKEWKEIIDEIRIVIEKNKEFSVSNK